MADKRSNILRFGIIYFIVMVGFAVIIGKVFYIMNNEYDELKGYVPGNDSTFSPLRAMRGNIYSADGQLMASSIPYYYLCMDMRVASLRQDNGKLFYTNVDSLAYCLSTYFQDRTPDEYRRLLTKGFTDKSKHLRLYPKPINYMQLQDVKQMPILRLGPIQGGLIHDDANIRVHPYGGLARRVIGITYPDIAKGGQFGLEKYFDELLRGTDGVLMEKYVAGRIHKVPVKEATNGADIYTTLDLRLQDMAERILKTGVATTQSDWGTLILMESATGEIKALANIARLNDSTFVQGENKAASSVEPGSTFKTTALMVALDQGKVRMTDTINVGNGQWVYADARKPITDWNDNTGGFGRISVMNVLEGSSNVGMSKIITEAFENTPKDFTDGLIKTGIMENIDIEIPGMGTTHFHTPKPRHGNVRDQDLAGMSYGYAVQLPPLNTVMFYGAIANGGKMMKPYLCRRIVSGNDVIQENHPTVVRNQICSSATLEQIREALHGVVWGKKGIATARAVQSDIVEIAGKTGTARFYDPRMGQYIDGQHRISFVGIFPYDNPQYVCMCVLERPRIGPHSGGTVTGKYVRQVAEQTMAILSTRDAETIDTTTIYDVVPHVKTGMFVPAHNVTQSLDIIMRGKADEWVRFSTEDSTLSFSSIKKTPDNTVPNLMGMGAKDAVFRAEQSGLQAHISGQGRVVEQSLTAGQPIGQNKHIYIRLH